MITIKNKHDRQMEILKIKNFYSNSWEQIMELSQKLGWKFEEMEQNPVLILHVFYAWLEEDLAWD